MGSCDQLLAVPAVVHHVRIHHPLPTQVGRCPAFEEVSQSDEAIRVLMHSAHSHTYTYITYPSTRVMRCTIPTSFIHTYTHKHTQQVEVILWDGCCHGEFVLAPCLHRSLARAIGKQERALGLGPPSP